MGTWISHLRIAEKLLDDLPELDEVAFACGNLAPDSGLPNADWTVFDPPKEVTHLLRPGEGEERARDLEFYRTYLAPLDPNGDRARYSFVLGYFFHLLTDILWALRISEPTQQRWADQFAEQVKETWGLVKDDWYGLDFRYLRDHPDSLFWRRFATAPLPPSPLPFIPQTALHHQLNYIRDFYRQPPEMVLDRDYPYLDQATMDRFVEDTTAAILKIHRLLQTEGAPPDQQTAVAFLSDAEKAPYPSVLGEEAEQS
jgi:hypothetical protein